MGKCGCVCMGIRLDSDGRCFGEPENLDVIILVLFNSVGLIFINGAAIFMFILPFRKALGTLYREENEQNVDGEPVCIQPNHQFWNLENPWVKKQIIYVLKATLLCIGVFLFDRSQIVPS